MTLPVSMAGMRRTSKLFTPISPLANRSSMYWFMPWTMETTAMRKVTPISTPMSEKKLFSFCVRMVRSAIRTASSSGIVILDQDCERYKPPRCASR